MAYNPPYSQNSGTSYGHGTNAIRLPSAFQKCSIRFKSGERRSAHFVCPVPFSSKPLINHVCLMRSSIFIHKNETIAHCRSIWKHCRFPNFVSISYCSQCIIIDEMKIHMPIQTDSSPHYETTTIVYHLHIPCGYIRPPSYRLFCCPGVD